MILEAPDLLAFKPRNQQGAYDHFSQFLAKNSGRTPKKDKRTVPAFVSENRWVADCPSCDAGMFCWSDNPECYCYRCGSVFLIEWPRDKQAGEQVLEERPPANRHWNPVKEPVAKLARENELMHEVEARPALVAEPLRAVFQVEHCYEGQIDKELLTHAKTGYVIRYDRVAQVAEVELLDRSDAEVARVKKLLQGK